MLDDDFVVVLREVLFVVDSTGVSEGVSVSLSERFRRLHDEYVDAAMEVRPEGMRREDSVVLAPAPTLADVRALIAVQVPVVVEPVAEKVVVATEGQTDEVEGEVAQKVLTFDEILQGYVDEGSVIDLGDRGVTLNPFAVHESAVWVNGGAGVVDEVVEAQDVEAESSPEVEAAVTDVQGSESDDSVEESDVNDVVQDDVFFEAEQDDVDEPEHSVFTQDNVDEELVLGAEDEGYSSTEVITELPEEAEAEDAAHVDVNNALLDEVVGDEDGVISTVTVFDVEVETDSVPVIETEPDDSSEVDVLTPPVFDEEGLDTDADIIEDVLEEESAPTVLIDEDEDDVIPSDAFAVVEEEEEEGVIGGEEYVASAPEPVPAAPVERVIEREVIREIHHYGDQQTPFTPTVAPEQPQETAEAVIHYVPTPTPTVAPSAPQRGAEGYPDSTVPEINPSDTERAAKAMASAPTPVSEEARKAAEAVAERKAREQFEENRKDAKRSKEKAAGKKRNWFGLGRKVDDEISPDTFSGEEEVQPLVIRTEEYKAQQQNETAAQEAKKNEPKRKKAGLFSTGNEPAYVPAEGEVDPQTWLESTILSALRDGASDLHIHVNGETKNLTARIRVDGAMQDYATVTGPPARIIMGKLKAATELSSSGSYAPEETIYTIELDGEKRKARAVIFRTEDGGEALVMRLPLTGGLKTLDKLNFSEKNLTLVKGLLESPSKLIMIAGPMGSGKTTTAHGAMLHVSTAERTVWTIEDPVERKLPDTVQLEIDEENGAGFDVLLSKLLRADYNTLFLGEIRDQATAAAGVRQAKAGRQVMSTIHANNNVTALLRLIELADDSALSVLDSVRGVISQRLLRALNPNWDGVDPKKKYSGRLPIHEVLIVDDNLIEVMMQNRPLTEIKNAAAAAVGSSFDEDCQRLLDAGLTDEEEIRRVIGDNR